MIEPPRDLTLPTSTGTLSRILSAWLRELARSLRELPRHRVLDPVLAVLARELTREPGRAFAILRRPSVSAPLRVFAANPTVERAELCAATIAVELAHAGAALEPLRFERAPKIVCLSGRFVLPPGPATLEGKRWKTATQTIELGDRDGSFHPIERSIVLALEDNNPLAMLEAHPGKSGNAIDLGGESVETWIGSLRGALATIAQFLPVFRAEIDLVLQQIAPVGASAETHLSASYREAIGTLYLTLHPSHMTMVEAIVHECSHNKINALFSIDEVLENAFEPLYASPVRPDPRPLHGVLLAVHAFLPVAELYRRMIEANDTRASTTAFARRYEEIVRKNHEGVRTLLDNARPTPIGRTLLEEIERIDASFG
jgi:HEXXH motif-containing protein